MIRTVHHRPPEASAGPRFTGPRTFMRLPHVQTTEDVDLAIVGVPTDDAVSFKSGARFGPEAVRSASVLLRPYNPHLAVDVVERLSMVDYGDAPTVPGYHEETLARIERHLTPLHEAGVTPLCVGGDHSIVLAELRAAARTHGPLAVVHLDAHADVWDEYYGARYFHGTVFKRAVEEGLVDPHRSVQAGMRGTLYGESDERAPGETACGRESATCRRSCRSTSTSSIPRSRPAPARRRLAGRRAARRSPTCARSPGSSSAASTASRCRRRTTRAASPRGWQRAPATR
jgi:hypothetical protein